MAICPSYGSSSEVSVYYTLDPDVTDADLTDNTLKWQQIRITGEALELSLTSTISEEITPQRSYSNSILTQGNVTGSFNFEASAGFLDNWFVSVLQATPAKQLRFISVTPTDDRWTHGEAIQNGSNKQCLALLKRVGLSNGNYDWYVFRGVQVGSMTMSFEPGAIVTGSVNILGTGGQVVTDSANGSANWTLVSDYGNPLMNSISSLTNLELRSSGGSDLGVVFQNFSMNLDNQLREQFGVGTDSIYAAGVASGRFMATMDASAYYSDATIYSNFVADNELKIAFSLTDSANEGWTFLFDKVKITGGSTPMAGGPDQDLLISSTFQAFESQSNGTVKITKVGAGS